MNLLNFLIFFILFENKLLLFSFAFLTEPKIVYVDGSQPWDNCRPGLKRSLSSLTGLLLSHPFYGSLPYNSSRNCFLTIVVPLGYQVRLKALDFDVQGQWGKCEREDTLHIFDHNQQLEPETLSINEQLPIGGHSPGKLLGEFCGKIGGNYFEKTIKNSHMILAESSKNALTLWWHTEEENKNQQINNLINSRINANGFRLLWSSFRNINNSFENCNKQKNNLLNNSLNNLLKEFKCIKSINSSKIGECIPSELGCNSYADCSDGSDLDPQLQLKYGCEHIPNVPLSILINSGPKRLLLCAALLLLWLTLCLGCCCCYISYRKNKIKKKRFLNNSNGIEENNLKKQLNNSERNPLFFQINGNIQQQQQNKIIIIY
ncbi:CUB domain-containing protein [Meloidogyne graminicola]|uniref:CUB domain-containing protein n=1 Tax=Meloidogyne graminicola TaxID=189291 RepID=A0A8S9ZHS2_9BILA|nr:CUB domain-containing protein [Meloidogyne graminicola]